MNPISVFSLRRPVRTARNVMLARTCRGLLVAAVATFPTILSVSAQSADTPPVPGTRDATFAPVTQPVATVYTVLYEADGSGNDTVLAGGDTGYLQTNLLPTGNPEDTFVAPTYGSAIRLVFTAVPEVVNTTDGPLPKILLGGLFGQSALQIFQKAPAQNIVRISPDGTLDTDFAAGVGAGANGYVTSILPQADGKIVVGGLFTTFNTLPRLRIARLMNNGILDASFSASSIIDNEVLALAAGVTPFSSLPGGALSPDGTILVGGTFNHVGGLPITKLARLKSDGAVDTTFHPVIDERVNAIVVQPSGKIIIGGQFTSVNGRPALGIARLNPDGSLDPSFKTTVTGRTAGEPNPTAVYVLKQLSSRGAFKVYVGGNFSLLNGLPRPNLGLIDANGAVQPFNPGVNLPGQGIYDKVQAIAVQPKGEVLIGETLGPKVNKVDQPTLIRLIGGTATN